MNEFLYQFISLDFPALGNFLVLRKMSLMGDAIAHAVLPGIVIGFIISGERSALPIFVGAAGAGLLTTLLIECVGRFGRLDSGTAMGVVFALMFALGVLLIEQAAARNIDLDPGCLLHGQLETIFWFPPHEFSEFFSLATLRSLPFEFSTSIIVLILVMIFVLVLFKELTISSFDPALATSLGFSSIILHYGLMAAIAASVVISFKAVGSILVIAMLICPAATARLLTDRLKVQILLSVACAFITTTLGYVSAAFGPSWFGFQNSLSAAGMMAVSSGCALGLAIIGAPRYGIIARTIRQASLGIRVAKEDLLGLLYRFGELSGQPYAPLPYDRAVAFFPSKLHTILAIRSALRDGSVTVTNNELILTDRGATAATAIIRTHRLWEAYLVKELGLRSDHVHSTATTLEHYSDPTLVDRLELKQDSPAIDPHGKEIPKKS